MQKKHQQHRYKPRLQGGTGNRNGKNVLKEQITDDRVQKWSDFPIDEPPAINPLDTASRYQNPGNLQTKDLAAPIVSIQNAPAVADPQGLNALSTLLGKNDIFKDITGLEGTQALANNAMLQNAISQKARIEAATAAMNALDKMKEKGQITPAKHEKKRKAIADTDWTKGMSDPIADVNGRPEDYGLGKKTGNMVDDITALGAAGVKSYKHDGMEVQFGEKDDEILDYGELYGVVIAAAEKYYKDNTTPAKALYELTEAEKQSMFLNGTWKQAAGILLYEFANNSGPGARTLFDRHSYTKALKASSAVNQMTESFISAYNDDQQYNNSCNDAGTTFSFSEKYNFSPEMEYAGLELGWLGFLVGTVFKTSFRALDSLLKHIRTAVSLNDEILITRGGMKFEFNYAEGSPTVQIVISDGYSLASLGGHILSSRIRNSSDVFGNTDIFIQMSIPTPTRLKVRP